MPKGKTILEKGRFALTIDRLCHELIENYEEFSDACIVGVQPSGVPLANRIHTRLLEILNVPTIDYGKLDVTFHRDDFRIRDTPVAASITDMDFLVEGKRVIMVDDVLYSGRTIQAALAALQHFGRPKQVELLTLVDRRFNRSLPIQSDYIGLTVDAINEAYVKVEWKETSGKDKVIFYSDKGSWL